MKVLIACEESQTVCKAFRALGTRRITVTSMADQEGIMGMGARAYD